MTPGEIGTVVVEGVAGAVDVVEDVSEGAPASLGGVTPQAVSAAMTTASVANLLIVVSDVSQGVVVPTK